MKELLLRSASCAAVGGIGSAVLFGDSGTINVAGMPVPTNLLIGAAIGAGSIVSDMLKENVIEKLQLPQNVVTVEEILVETAISGAAATVVLSFAGLPSTNYVPAFLWGGGAKHIGNYSYDKLLNPKMGMIPLF